MSKDSVVTGITILAVVGFALWQSGPERKIRNALKESNVSDRAYTQGEIVKLSGEIRSSMRRKCNRKLNYKFEVNGEVLTSET